MGERNLASRKELDVEKIIPLPMLHANAQHTPAPTLTPTHIYTHSGFPVTEQVRLSESPSRKMPCGGVILTMGATMKR